MFTNVMFYVGWAVLALLPLMVAIVAPQTVKGKIIACLCVLAVTCGVVALIYKDAENANDCWNNGICECGGTYELSAASQRHASKSFYYTCDKCGHTEEFSSLMK
jgi:hypothetical protein